MLRRIWMMRRWVAVELRPKRLPRVPRSVWFLSPMAPRRDPRHPETLRTTREAGAIEAVRRLGVSSESVTFLRLPGGAAKHHVHEITHAVVSMLKSWRPQSVFVNYAKYPASDHVAVNAAVGAALRGYGRPCYGIRVSSLDWYHCVVHAQ
ncbi:hypothetical protein BQ8794_50047 [Mesorhizobium prunaredense]|uniref:LmbE family protein n=1 Tax=Mesorhizobium prunaredense TaxID=1631249 RepID=A0A1R3VDH5_9HYPH|nr:hypothetical protein BQ8794_50047 [Mesorhizobium prunaredense]